MIAGGNKNYKELNACGSIRVRHNRCDVDRSDMGDNMDGNVVLDNGVQDSGNRQDCADMDLTPQLSDIQIKKQKLIKAPRDIL